MNRPNDTLSIGGSMAPSGDQMNETIAQSKQQLEFALQAGRMGSWELDIASGQMVTSEFCRIIFGLDPDDPSADYEDILSRIHPEDRQRRQDAVDHAIATGTDLEIEHRILHPDGRVSWVETRGRAAYEDGRAVRAAGVSLDVTERKTAEEHQRLLLDELNHRVKNTLATVQSIAFQMRRADEASAALSDAFIERLHALARAHDLLTEGFWQGAALAEVIGRTLAQAAVQDGPARVSLSGPDIRLGPNAAVTLNMAFHELTTNAIKYGALSAAGGRVEVAWRADGDAAVAIDWREFGGPPVVPPVRRGFGSRLIEEALPREMAGEARLVFRPEGLCCEMRFPLSSKLSLAA